MIAFGRVMRHQARELHVRLWLTVGAWIMTADRTVTEPIAATGTSTISADIAIVGGGLAGSLAAAVLARAGHRITLIDKRAIYPDEFRVEKIGGHQLEMLRKLGFLDALGNAACRYDRVLN